MKTKWITTALLVVCAVHLVSVLFANRAAAQTVRLLPTATLERGPVALGQVATITDATPAEIDRLSQTVMLQDLPAKTTLKAEDALFAIVSQLGSGYASTVQVQGAAACIIEVKAADPVPAPVPAPLPESPPASTVTAVSITDSSLPAASPSGADSLAKLLTDQLVAASGVEREDLRITFETPSDLLNSPTPDGAHWLIKAVTHEGFGTLQWDCQLQQGNALAHRLRIQATVLKRTQILVAAKDLTRNSIISAGDFRAIDRWLDRPSPTVLLHPEQAVGMEVFLRNIPAGDAMDARDLRAVDLVARGDLVTVYCVSGGLTLKSQGRAETAGKMHELVWLTDDISAESARAGQAAERFQARLIGRGVAVLGDRLTDEEEAKLKELR